MVGKLRAELIVVHNVQSGPLNSHHNVVNPDGICGQAVFFSQLLVFHLDFDDVLQPLGAVKIALVEAAVLFQRPFGNFLYRQLCLIAQVGAV